MYEQCSDQPAQLLASGSGRRLGPSTVAGARSFHRLIVMRYGSSLWLTCLVTTCSLAGSGEASAQEAGQAPPPAIAPFDAAQAKLHQKAWADHLGTAVESTNSIGMKFVLIPPGEFMMGSPESEAGRGDSETQRRVTIASPFSLGVHELTQSQYEQVMGINPSRFNVENYPVERVSWDVAVAFCEKLSALPEEVAAGRVYRLPTEEEWEYACRAGSTTEYSFGDDEKNLGRYAWFNGNSRSTTQAVGKKLPNDWGLYDMHGNVWEWCSDRAGDYPKGAVTDPVGPSTGSVRVVRGGSWNNDAADCRTADHLMLDPTFRSNNLGFRLALSSLSVHSPEAKPVK